MRNPMDTQKQNKTKVRPIKGHIVAISFLDHAEDSDVPIECIVYGRLYKTSRQAYVVDSWVCDHPDVDKSATKRFVILKKVVSDISVLRP